MIEDTGGNQREGKHNYRRAKRIKLIIIEDIHTITPNVNSIL
jgi:hypothetical protein